MGQITLLQRLGAEFLGTALLLGCIIGSGIMGTKLAAGNLGGNLESNLVVILLAHSIAIGAILYVLITMLGPISGAHFNPAVTFTFWLKAELSRGDAALYVAAQILGGLAGVWLTHICFELDVIQVSQNARTGIGQWLAEVIATFGLVITILLTLKARESAVPASVGLYIMAAIWFTASACFANPAVTITRAFSDTFAGIRPQDVPMFIIAEIIGAICALWVYKLFYPESVGQAVEVKKAAE